MFYKCLVCLSSLTVVFCAPSLRIFPEHQLPPQLLTLPGNATSIRSNIADGFSCEGRTYGYYADVDNDCQLFHVCLPITYASGRTQVFRWSFICPEETVFNQEMFTCTRADESIDCFESPRYYNLNRNLNGEDTSDTTTHTSNTNDDDPSSPEVFGQHRPPLLQPSHHQPISHHQSQHQVDDATSVPEVAQQLELFENQHAPGSDREPKPIYSRRISKL